MFRKPTASAIPTIFGWADPRTGEILVSMRGIPNPVENFKPGRPYTITLKEDQPKMEVASSDESPKIQPAPEKTNKPAPVRKRPKAHSLS